VDELYPRIVYILSDVICFVTEATNTAEVTLGRLIKWADKTRSGTLNQPALPHAIIIVNGTKSNPEEWLDENVATRQMLQSRGQIGLSDRELVEIAKRWEGVIGTSPMTLYDILSRYFGNIRVVYIPPKDGASHDIIYRQLQKLRARVETESRAVRSSRGRSGSLWDAEQLSAYIVDTFEHYTNDLNRPFDFFKSFRENNPIPKGFTQHMTDLMRLMSASTRDQSEVDRRVAALVSSYILFEFVKFGTRRKS
jgi:hypothetical protein